MNHIQNAKKDAKELLLAALGQAIAEGALFPSPIPEFNLEIPADSKNGDLATNIALVSAKAFSLPPRKIAGEIVARLYLEQSSFSKVEIAGPGFINFFYSSDFYASVLANVLEEGEDYGKSPFGEKKKVMVEFVSANPTGPMHMGNARGGALGDCLASVLDYAGFDVTREFYVNDAGNQIEKFGRSLEARYLQILHGEESVPFPEDGYHGDDIKEHAKNFYQLYGAKLDNLTEEERRQALVDYALPINLANLKRDLSRYRIGYDVWFRESSLYETGEVFNAINLLKEKGLTYEQDGALWYKATLFGGEKDEVLIRQNGHPSYFAADIAYHINKLEVRKFDKVIDIWGADHHGHVARMKGAMDAVGLNKDKLDIIIMQLVRLTRSGEVVRMSKRTGKAISLEDLLEEIPIDAARFFFNLREPNSHLEFDLDLAVSQSSQNPVYYVQYAHARICSILKNLAAEGIQPQKCTSDDYKLLTQPEELAILQHIATLPNEIVEAAKIYDPAKITRYCIETANLFHRFYNAHRVKGSEDHLMQARISLCLAVKTVLHNVLTMFKIQVPESM